MLGFLQMKLAFIFAKYGKFTEKQFYCKNMQYSECTHQNTEHSANTSSNHHPSSFSFDDYDVILFSNEAISAMWSIPKGITTLYYAHSISRHLFDLHDAYLEKVPKFAKIPYRIMAYFLRLLYTRELQRMDLVLTNSPANVARLKAWCQRDADVLFPPVDTTIFQPESSHTPHQHILDTHANAHTLPPSFFISFARVTKVKGIDSIIRAFQQIPNQHILIIFGINDSDREAAMQLADIPPTDTQNTIITSKTFPNISFLSLQNNSDLPHIIARATATICMSHNEDFGMVAIESMACGIPVIAPNE